MYTVFNMANTNNAKTIWQVLTIVAGIITGLLGIQLAFLVGGDILAGALHGEPETGWGIAIAVIFVLPVLLISLTLFIFFYRRYKRASNLAVAIDDVPSPGSGPDNNPTITVG